MSITNVGIKGEQKAREILKQNGFNIFQADWIAKTKNNYCLIEVKHKEMFKKPPFDGHGLDLRQVFARMEFYKKTKIPTILLIINLPDDKVYWEYLHKLEEGEKFDTRNNVRIYPLINFNSEETLKEVYDE